MIADGRRGCSPSPTVSRPSGHIALREPFALWALFSYRSELSGSPNLSIGAPSAFRVYIASPQRMIEYEKENKEVSRISDSIYYTLLSDGCSREKAAQSARSLNDPLLYNRFDFYPAISSPEGCETMHLFPCGTVRGNPGHPGSYSKLSIR